MVVSDTTRPAGSMIYRVLKAFLGLNVHFLIAVRALEGSSCFLLSSVDNSGHWPRNLHFWLTILIAIG